jgi:hypothetical protein
MHTRTHVPPRQRVPVRGDGVNRKWLTIGQIDAALREVLRTRFADVEFFAFRPEIAIWQRRAIGGDPAETAPPGSRKDRSEEFGSRLVRS